MPSLWKNKISRLVADFQNPPKRGGTLVVETGFPTSLIDLFQKNKTKFRKLTSKKNHKSCQEFDAKFPNLPLVTNPSPLNSKEPTCLNFNYNHVVDRHCDDADVFEEFIESSEECGDDEEKTGVYIESTEKCGDDKEKTGVYIESSEEFGDDEEKTGVYLSKNVFWWTVWGGIIVSGAALYDKKIVCGIVLATLLSLLLENVGNSVFRLFMRCENGFVWRGVLVVLVVGLCTVRFVVGISVVAMLLVVLDLVGKAVFRHFRGYGEEVLEKGVLELTSKKEDLEEGGNSIVLKREIKQEEGNLHVLTRGIDLEDDEGNGITREWRLQGENDGSILMSADVSSIEKEVRNEPICEVKPLERNYSVWPRQPVVCDSNTSVCELSQKEGKKGGKGKWGGSAYVVDEKGKVKKKKFWKNLVPKHMRKKKKYMLGRELSGTSTGCVVDGAQLEEEDELVLDDGKVGIVDGEISSMPSSSDEEEESEVDVYVHANRTSYAMLQIDSRSNTCKWMEKVKDGNLKCLILVAIPLAGLIRGRLFAQILTIMSCLLFKMVRG